MDPMADLAAAGRLLARSGDAAALRVATALEEWRSSAEITLEEALGRAPGWRAAWRLRRRDEAALRMALQFPNLSDRALAVRVTKVVSRYETSAWRRDRVSGHRPDGVNGLAFDILIHGGLPGVEHLRRLLGNYNGRNPQPRPACCPP
jgi:hypothetical protein